MRAKTIYKTIHGNYSLYPCSLPGEEKTPVQAHFIQTKSVGDFNRVTFEDKPKTSTRTESRVQRYFIPAPGANPKEIERALNRGRTFFSKQYGFQVGAMIDLAKMVEFVSIQS